MQCTCNNYHGNSKTVATYDQHTVLQTAHAGQVKDVYHKVWSETYCTNINNRINLSN